MNTAINKIVVVEGLDKTGKSTFVNKLEQAYINKIGNDNSLSKFSFPNKSTPIGNSIRVELNKDHPNSEVVSTPNFLSEMSHYWMQEIFKWDFKNSHTTPKNYLFDRYFISTLAYQAFYNNSVADLNFIRESITNNKFLKIPTDLIMLDLPNPIIIERTIKDELVDQVDAHDTKDLEVIDRRRDAYSQAMDFLKEFDVNIHLFRNISEYDTVDLADILVEKIFK